MQIGQHVLCIKDQSYGGHGTEIRPVVGKVYTVRDFWSEQVPFYGTVNLILLNEIRNIPQIYRSHGERPSEFRFHQEFFKPLNPIKIETFLTQTEPLELV